MKSSRRRFLSLSAGLPLLASCLPGQETPKKKQILFIGKSMDFAHDSVSHGFYTIKKLGEESGLFDVRFRTDTELLTKKPLKGNRKNLDWFDALFFYSQGDLPLTDDQKADIMSFVREDGKGLLAAHAGTDSFRASWPEYIEMVGGAFDHHPWHKEVVIKVDDRSHPITEHFPEQITITDEIYQLSHYDRNKVRVLMTLDTNSVDLKAKNVKRTDGDFAISWVRDWGKGRVFTSVLGHRPEVWDRPDIQRMWLQAVRWTLGMVDGKIEPIAKPSGK